MKRSNTPFYPAHPSNYTKGRGGKSIKYVTFHHTAAPNTTLRYLWADPNRNGSSHYFVGIGKNKHEQYVLEADTAWTNGNFASNQESITIETRGDWRFGYTSQETINNLIELVKELRSVYPGIKYNTHRQVSSTSTVCPGDLPVDLVWAAADPTPTATTPPVKSNLRVDIPDKKVILTEDTNVWDMSFTTWSGKNKPKAVGSLKKGTIIDIAGEYDHPLSTVDYYLSNWAWTNNKNWGISKAACKDYVEPKPVVVPPKNTTNPVDNPVEEASDQSPTGGQGMGQPLPQDLNGEKLNEILTIVTWIKNFLNNIFKRGE